MATRVDADGDVFLSRYFEFSLPLFGRDGHHQAPTPLDWAFS